jgi:hypothetical protein
MAYITQETKKKLSPGIKAVLTKYGLKGSIGIRHNSTLVVKIKDDTLGIIDNWYTQASKQGSFRPEQKPTHLSINPYWVTENYTGKVQKFVVELITAMKGDVWFDKSDIMTDYHHTAYYLDIEVGR